METEIHVVVFPVLKSIREYCGEVDNSITNQFIEILILIPTCIIFFNYSDILTYVAVRQMLKFVYETCTTWASDIYYILEI